MTRIALALLGLAFGLLSAQPALAQIGGLTGGGATGSAAGRAFSTNVEVFIDDEEVPNDQTVYIGKPKCQEGVIFKFKLTGYNQSSPINNLELWASSGTDCSSASNRLTNTTTTPPCWLVGEKQAVSGDVTIDGIDSLAIFKKSADDDSGECPDRSGNKYTVYFVALPNPTESSPASPPEPIAGIESRTAVFTLYTQTPAYPATVTSRNGESQLQVDWDKAAGFTNLSNYRVVFDTSVGSDSTCSSSLLVQDSVPPEADNVSLFATNAKTGMSALLKDLDKKQVAIHDYVAAAVVHQDQAGNDSNLSEVMCIERVEVDGFLEVCERDPECRGGFNSCSVDLGGRRGPVLALLVWLALLIGFVVRRRPV
jgi:hypothetical protein